MIVVDLRVAKQSFFDAKKVRDAMDKVTLRALSKAGAFVRRRARSSIRRTKKSSVAGQPPRAHSRDSHASIKTILFFYDPDNKSVIIGPVKLNGRTGGSRNPLNQTVPQLLEFGGRMVSRQRRRSGEQRGLYTYSQQPRPFMQPALEAEAPKVPLLFKNQLDKV